MLFLAVKSPLQYCTEEYKTPSQEEEKQMHFMEDG
jgi:hypothetical protein